MRVLIFSRDLGLRERIVKLLIQGTGDLAPFLFEIKRAESECHVDVSSVPNSRLTFLSGKAIS